MAALDTKRAVARKWLTGERERGHRALANMIDNGPQLLSYGSHFPLAFKDGPDGDHSIMVNVDRYQLDLWPVSGKPKYSRVTDDQQRALAWELDRAGFKPIDAYEVVGRWRYQRYVKGA